MKKSIFSFALAILCMLPQASLFANEPAYLLVLNSRSDTISRIDPRTYELVDSVWIGREPHHLLATPDERYVVVGITQTDELVLINPRSGAIEKRIPGIKDPYHLGFSRDGKWFVTTANRLDFIDLYHYKPYSFTLAARIRTPSVPSHLIFDDKGIVYVTLQGSNQVWAVRLSDQSVIWKKATGEAPAGLWLTPDQKHLIVANTGTDTVQIMDPATGEIRKKFRSGKGAHNFLPMGDSRHLLLSNRMEDTISLIDMNTLRIIRKFKVPGGPDDMELRNDGTELWVTSRWRNRVSVIDTRTFKIKKTIRVGRSPHGLYFHDHASRM